MKKYLSRALGVVKKSEDTFFATPNNGLFKIEIPTIQKWMFSEGEYYEENVSCWFSKILSKISETNKQPVILDIGANCGYYTLLAGRSKGALVYAFEPAIETLRLLKKNVRLNNLKNISIYPYAISDTRDKLTFFTYNSSGNNSLIKRDIPDGHELKYQKSYQVQSEKLDDFMQKQDIKSCSLIKIDIEGAELFALKGGGNTISRDRPVIIVEYSEATSRDAGYAKSDIFKLLNSYGYVSFGISEDNVSTKLYDLSKLKDHSTMANILAVHKSSKELLSWISNEKNS